jgi:hypothetical protein
MGLAAARQVGDFGTPSRLSAQGERFFDNFTLRGHAGQERSALGGWRGLHSLARATATWHAHPKGVRHLRAGRSHGHEPLGLGAEWQLGNTSRPAVRCSRS